MHLYLHVPFCARRCSYCDFAIAVRREIPAREYADSVLSEWAAWQSHPAWLEAPELDTVYFGGGTPSRLPPEILTAILERLGRDRRLAPAAEITLEANPDDVNPAAATAWRDAGINRVSLGAQSFSATVLEWMHRTHTVAQIEQAHGILRQAGFGNISLDLIYGLPGELRRDWAADLDRALALGPAHLSFYGLTVESGTPLARWTARGETVPLPEQRAAGEFLLAHERLEAAGFEHYEISNAARPGFRARHNSAYWARQPFIGLGPAAHSAFGTIRAWNVRDWEEYRRRTGAGRTVRADSENLQDGQIELEQLYLGLRTTDGVPALRIPIAVSERWRAAGWATEMEGSFRLSAEGWLRLDALVASLTHC